MFGRSKVELKQSLDSELAQARDVLLDDPKILRRKVSRVSALGDRNGHALALYTLAAGHRFSWTPDDWAAVLEKLDNCNMTVADWLENLEQKDAVQT